MTVCESVQVCSWQSFSYSVSFSDFTVCLLYACHSHKQTYYFSSDNNTFLFLSLSFTHTQTHIVKKSTYRGSPGQPCARTTVLEENTLWCRGSPGRLHLPPHPGMITRMGNGDLDFLQHSCTHTHKQTHIHPHWCQCTHKHVKGCIQVYKMLSGWTVWSINLKKYIRFPVTHYCLLSVYLVQLSFPHCLSHSIFSPSWNWHVCLLEECWLFHS